MTTLAIIEGEPITLSPTGSVRYRSKAAIDTDGTGPSHGDPDAQGDTSLHVHGHPLDADVDRYIVVPPAIRNGVSGIVLGCHAWVTNSLTGKSCSAVVGDIGPHDKLGEISRATAIALGIDPSPTTGGEDRHVISYVLWPGLAAPGYALQPA